MKKCLMIFVTVVLVFMSVCVCGCSKNISLENVEEEIIQNASDTPKIFIGEKMSLEIDREEDCFLLYPKGRRSEAFTMLIPCNFEENNDFEIPDFTDNGELPKECRNKLDKAIEIAKQFVSESSLIKDEDKEECIQYLEEITSYYVTFSDAEYGNVGMVTNGNSIYVNEKMAQYLDVKFYLHECIHVISNCTNVGSDFEFSYYRSSKLNEAVTDILTEKLAEKFDLKANEYASSGYTLYYDYANILIAKTDYLSTYFYSDGYHEIIDTFGKDVFDLYCLVVDWTPNTSQQWVADQLVIEYFK